MEKELLTRISGGDEAAFAQLFNVWHQRLGAFIYRLTESPTLTQEIVQDVFLRLWLKRHLLGDVKDVKAYLFTAARNQTFNSLRKIARQRNGQAQLLESLSVSENHPQEEMDTLEVYTQLLDQAVQRLPNQQQKVYLLHRRQGLSHAQIAEQLHLSVETVKKHMQLALKALRQDLSFNGRHTEAMLLILTTTIIFF
jgi:RNA polymerase sigma-70 factor (family 1)